MLEVSLFDHLFQQARWILDINDTLESFRRRAGALVLSLILLDDFLDLGQLPRTEPVGQRHVFELLEEAILHFALFLLVEHSAIIVVGASQLLRVIRVELIMVILQLILTLVYLILNVLDLPSLCFAIDSPKLVFAVKALLIMVLLPI